MDERRVELCRYRLAKAMTSLNSAEALVKSEDYCGSANRSYYAIFHSIRSILALDGTDFSKHAGVMSYFQKYYVKTGIFEKEYSTILTEAFEVRTESDYDDFYVISKDEVEKQIQNSRKFLEGVSSYVERRMKAN